MWNANTAVARGLEAPQPANTRIFRVLIDGRKLADGGIGVYTENLILGLLESKRALLTVIADPEKSKIFSWQNQVDWIPESSKLYSLDELLWMPGRIDFSRYDLFHEPHYTLPFRIPIPSVVTIHDLIHITHPQKFYYPVIAKKLIRSAAKRASEVVFVSNAAKGTYLSLIPGAKRNLGKLHVVPNSMQELPKSSAKTATEKSYVLMVASNSKPHKGLADGVKAFETARKKLGEHAPELVIVGYGSEEWSKEELPAFVHVRGAVSKSELLTWYQGAQALLVPSLAEGFCVPALEAKSLGVRVIARPVPAIQEVLEGTGFIAEDFSVPSLAVKITEALQTEQSRVKIPHKQSLARFERSTVTEQMLKIYERAVTT